MQEVFINEIKELIPHRHPTLFIEYVQVFPEKKTAISRCNPKVKEVIKGYKREQISIFYFIEGIFQTAGVLFNILYGFEEKLKKKKFLSRLDEVRVLGELCNQKELIFKVEVRNSNRFNDKFYGEILSNNKIVLSCNVTSSIQIN
ncbi:hypothetical protein LCM23_21465 [Cytobacillus kochii]|uniref:hypothetical protein n=1 Tax=Cytobacillus kochii TaxID=859143 RepID=UPI001CD50627|nr:hypothetical protein [Cytobacillus kochii]MCA1028642.1 hypothetical protein [Cytobacillus kochii]